MAPQPNFEIVGFNPSLSNRQMIPIEEAYNQEGKHSE